MCTRSTDNNCLQTTAASLTSKTAAAYWLGLEKPNAPPEVNQYRGPLGDHLPSPIGSRLRKFNEATAFCFMDD